MPLEHRHHARCGCASTGFVEHASAARPFALPSSTRHFERDRPFAIEHLAARPRPRRRRAEHPRDRDARRSPRRPRRRRARARRRRLRRRASVTVDGSAAPFRYDGAHALGPDRAAARQVRASPSRIARRRDAASTSSSPTSTTRTRPRQVWSQCQEEDARHLIPCHDSPHVEDDDRDHRRTCRTGGTRCRTARSSRATSRRSATGRFHWKMDAPHPSYLMTLVAGEFAEIDRRGARSAIATVPARLPRAQGPRGRRRAHVRRARREMIEHFSEITGVAYPWNKYAQVVVARLHLRRDGEHHRHDDVRAHPARRARRARRHVATTSSPTSSRTSGSATTSRAAPGTRAGSTRASRRSSSTSGARSTSGATSTPTALKADLDGVRRRGARPLPPAHRLPGLRRAARSLRPPPLREGRARPARAPRRARRRALLERRRALPHARTRAASSRRATCSARSRT